MKKVRSSNPAPVGAKGRLSGGTGRRRAWTAMLAACALAAAALAASGCGSSASSSSSTSGSASAAAYTSSGLAGKKVFLLAPFNITPWPQYYVGDTVSAIRRLIPGVKVTVLSANSSQATELSNIDAAISQGANLVLYAPVNPLQSAAGLNKLAAAKIPTLGYVHDADGGPVDGFVWVNVPAVAQWWGNYLEKNLVKRVGHSPVRLAIQYGDPTFKYYTDMASGLNPAVKALEQSGQVKVVCKADTPGWAPAVAQQALEQCLTKTGNGVDAVLVMNDSTADGVAAALQSQKLLGKVLIWGGHDGDQTAVQRIVAGDQIGTFEPDYQSLSAASARMVQAVLQGKTLKGSAVVNATFDNDFVKGGVPSYFSPEIPITRASVQLQIIDKGYYTKQQVCAGVAVSSPFCTHG
jgi:D-xylose transport system substrate-binding protein